MGNSPQTQTGADTVRCDAWKDEVQNLLIFAGLFSAVVTAFVIESYKFLQPSPNDAAVVYSSRLQTASKHILVPPSVDPASITTPFSPTSSAIRSMSFSF
ncbi:hypothetical protein BJ912DRAFT_255367 [Pholiota molesta]|nr:hypothetical protein BJ912DRAFT_255367 [Pholiota molesta]